MLNKYCCWCCCHLQLRVRILFWPAHAHLSLTCTCASHLCLRMHISFLPAHAPLIFACAFASHFYLLMRISFLPDHTHLLLACACASHLDLLMRISIWPARAHLILACTWRLEENLQLVLPKLFVDQRRQNKNSHNWSSPVPAPCAKCSHLHLGKRNNTCSCCARPGRLHWPVLNVWWTPNPNCRQMLMQISANK